MENQYQKYVNISYILFSALIAFIVLIGFMKLSDAYDLETKLSSIEFVIRGGSVAIGVGLFLGLYFSSKANLFMNEVMVELLTKVSWPTSKETSTATIVVIITVILAGLLLAFFDWLFVILLRGIL